MSAPVSLRTPVSIVCVFNDLEVLEQCLSRSVAAGLSGAPETEFLPVDNRHGAFSTAGAALNHGAGLAHNAVVVFVHQDVVLHSLKGLERAAHILMGDAGIGIIGAVGIDSHRRIIGRMRDRVVQIGASAPLPRDVDSLDEVLFMVRRDLVRVSPLSEDSLLAWHAYGVEYSARVRRAGMRATAMNLVVTHNSLTTNLARLELAHRKVGDDYPELLPIQTTCGTVHRVSSLGGLFQLVRRIRGAAIWWEESLEARAVARHVRAEVVLADIRLIVDEALRRGEKRELRVLDVASTPESSVDGLTRFDRDYRVSAVTISDVQKIIDERPADQVILVTGMHRADFLTMSIPRDTSTAGFWHDTGLWMLVGIESDALAPLWSTVRNRPFAGILPQRRPHSSPQSGARSGAG